MSTKDGATKETVALDRKCIIYYYNLLNKTMI